MGQVIDQVRPDLPHLVTPLPGPGREAVPISPSGAPVLKLNVSATAGLARKSARPNIPKRQILMGMARWSNLLVIRTPFFEETSPSLQFPAGPRSPLRLRNRQTAPLASPDP